MHPIELQSLAFQLCSLLVSVQFCFRGTERRDGEEEVGPGFYRTQHNKTSERRLDRGQDEEEEEEEEEEVGPRFYTENTTQTSALRSNRGEEEEEKDDEEEVGPRL